MNREEVKKILGEEATDAQVTSFLNFYHSQEKAKNDEINSYKSKMSEKDDYDAIKQELEDLKKANMTQEELMAAKQKELDKEIEKVKSEELKYLKKQNSLEAKSILIDAGITNEDELKGILNSISTDNKDLTISNATNIANSIKAIKEATEKTVKEQLMKSEPNPSNNGNDKKSTEDTTMTKAKFESLTYTEQKEWKDKNLEEYHKMYE